LGIKKNEKKTSTKKQNKKRSNRGQRFFFLQTLGFSSFHWRQKLSAAASFFLFTS